MARLSINVITSRGETHPIVGLVREASAKSRLSFDSTCFGYEGNLAEIAEWVILPEIIVFDLPDGKDAFVAMEELAGSLPEGDVELILTNVSNDISTYRRLRENGVSEVFAGLPTQEEIDQAVEYIATREIRATEIDPRRVAYVWSCAGGSGGTSVALGFSRYLSKIGQRTLHIDMDIHTAPASYMFRAKEGANETTGLIEALVTPSRVDSVFLERAIQKVDKNLFYLSARKRSSEVDFEASALSRIIARAQKNFDMVIVDTPWRPEPGIDWGKIHGPSYVVAAPNATSYLGFGTVVKELENSSSRSPVYGVLNRSGEYKANDFNAKAYKSIFDGEFYELPYDSAAAGRMFFTQMTMSEIGGKIQKPFRKVCETLPKVAIALSESRRGLFVLPKFFGG